MGHTVSIQYLKRTGEYAGSCSQCPWSVSSRKEKDTRSQADFHERNHK